MESRPKPSVPPARRVSVVSVGKAVRRDPLASREWPAGPVCNRCREMEVENRLRGIHVVIWSREIKQVPCPSWLFATTFAEVRIRNWPSHPKPLASLSEGPTLKTAHHVLRSDAGGRRKITQKISIGFVTQAETADRGSAEGKTTASLAWEPKCPLVQLKPQQPPRPSPSLTTTRTTPLLRPWCRRPHPPRAPLYGCPPVRRRAFLPCRQGVPRHGQPFNPAVTLSDSSSSSSRLSNLGQRLLPPSYVVSAFSQVLRCTPVPAMPRTRCRWTPRKYVSVRNTVTASRHVLPFAPSRALQ